MVWKEKIEIEVGCTYLSQSNKFVTLPKNKILDKGKVGCGGTSLATESPDKYVICVPFVSLIQNKVSQYPNERFKGSVFGFYQGVTKKSLEAYLKDNPIPKIFVTYDSLEKLMKWIPYSEYKLLIDELHLLFTQYSFRSEAVQTVLQNYSKFKEFCFMTATPLEDDFTLEELKHIPTVELIWSNTKTVKVESVRCRNKVINTVCQLVNDADKYEENFYFFVNSVNFIKKVVEACNLDSGKCRVIYSKNNNTDVGITRGAVLDEPRKINFITSTCYEGSDFYDENGLTFIISDSSLSHTLVDISTSFNQIAGRIRNSKHSGVMYHLFSHTRYSDVSYNEYKEVVNKGIDEAQKTIQLLNNADEQLVNKIKNLENEDYLVKVNGQFRFDPNKVKIDLFNYKITRGLYSLRVNMVDEYIKNGYDVENFDHRAEKLMSLDVIQSNFEDVVKQVEKELSNTYRLATPISDAAFKKYPFLKEAIDKLGFEEIKKSNYVITNLKNKLVVKSDSGNENKIFKILKNKLNVCDGDFIASNLLKKYFSDIYKSLKIAKTGKASDITSYYEVKPSTRRQNGKAVRGYLLIRPKIKF